jgi:hypothetical protein
MEEWDSRVERVVLQLRPVGYRVPEVLEQSKKLYRQVTRFANPSKVVKAFLEHVEEVREWKDEARVLYDFVKIDKRLPDFQRAKRLLAEVKAAEDVPGAEGLKQEDAQRWREQLSDLIESGRVAHEWEAFEAAITPLRERFRQVYAKLHARREEIYQKEAGALRDKGIAADDLSRYTCHGMSWDRDRFQCESCETDLDTLDLHIRLIPAEAERIRKRVRDRKEGPYAPEENVAYIHVAKTVPSSRIVTEADLNTALDVLRRAVTKALSEADAVELE